MSRPRRDAIEAYRRERQLIASCIADGVVIIRGTTGANHGSAGSFAAVLGSDTGVDLIGVTSLNLLVVESFIVHPRIESGTRDWQTTLTSYAYAFRHEDGSEILAYHWHPQGAGFVPFPHLHIGAVMIASDAPLRPGDFHRAHLPTQHVTIADIVRLAIIEFGVSPLRQDWRAVLDQ
jgi:hypothetical protein